MRVYVFGTRGIPGIQGGVERHCENLYPLLANNCEISIFRRKPFIHKPEKRWKNIGFIDLPSTQINGFEAFFHSFLCTIVSIVKHPDIVHIHNIGPAIFTPLLHLFGIKVVVTYHSPNYEHSKWSSFARIILRLGEFLALKYANHIIFVNQKQREKFKRISNKSVCIPNGVKSPTLSQTDTYIHDLGLSPRKYILAVGRFTQEKGFDYLVDAYKSIENNGYRLVIAGGADHESIYTKQLSHKAKSNNVILSGFVTGEKLNQLYTYASLFVLPSYNEGLPIALLEAMSYNLPVIVSNIPANKEIGLPDDNYFQVGDTEQLARKLQAIVDSEFQPVHYNMDKYNWDKIAEQTEDVYKIILNHSNHTQS